MPRQPKSAGATSGARSGGNVQPSDEKKRERTGDIRSMDLTVLVDMLGELSRAVGWEDGNEHPVDVKTSDREFEELENTLRKL